MEKFIFVVTAHMDFSNIRKDASEVYTFVNIFESGKEASDYIMEQALDAFDSFFQETDGQVTWEYFQHPPFGRIVVKNILNDYVCDFTMHIKRKG